MNLIFTLALFILPFITLSSQDLMVQLNNKLDKVEEEIWSLEEDYISFFKKAKHKEILSLMHTKGLVWPASKLQPIGKEDVVKFLEEKYPSPSMLIFNIKQKGIRVMGNVIITHYLLTISRFNEDGEEQISENRITHTWIKENTQWKIFGGMSSSE